MLEVIESVIKGMLELAAESGAHRFAVGYSRGRSGWARTRRQRRRRRWRRRRRRRDPGPPNRFLNLGGRGHNNDETQTKATARQDAVSHSADTATQSAG